jgi:dTMP kinase
MKKKGLFITLYGINNIGKSTHAIRLVNRLNSMGYKAKHVKYPIYDLSPTGPFLNTTLRSSHAQEISEDELQLWFVMNRYQFEPELKKLLAEGYIVVAEDYIGTGIAWGVAKGLDESWMEGINKHLLKSDFSILFEGERNVSAKESKHLHEQNDELSEKCRKIHSSLADKYGWERLPVQEKKDDTTELLWNIVDLILPPC